MFEIIHTCTEWYDGLRRGIADYQGNPHLVVSEWTDIGEASDTFLLSPVNPETFRLALEDWAIWLRWDSAFDQGHTTIATHPALPEDRDRHDELHQILAEQLVIDPAGSVRKGAEFRALEGVWKVRWIEP